MAQVIPSLDFLIDASKGGWAYHEALGWVRNSTAIELFVYNDTSTFIIPDDDSLAYDIKQTLLFENIQSLHLFGGEFGGAVFLDPTDGTLGFFSAFETQRATEILNPDGFTHPFAFGSDDRRINAGFGHNNVNIELRTVEGTTGVLFDGITTVDVEDEEGNLVTNTAPNILVADLFNYKFKITKSLSQTMYLYVNDVLIGNPTFAPNVGGKGGERLLYSSGASGGTNRISYIKIFGAKINTAAPKRTTPWELTNADIVAALPKLADVNVRADSGTTTSLVSERLKDMNVEIMTGATICFITGFSFGVDSTITDFDPNTGTITFTEIVDAVDSTTVVGIVYHDFFTYSHRAYGIIENEMRNKGIDIKLFLNHAQMKELHLTKTIELICLSKRQDADDEDLYHESYLLYSDKYMKELDNIRADYDLNEDGIISDDEQTLTEQVTLIQ